MLKIMGAVGLGIGRVVGEGVEHPLPDQLFASPSRYAFVGAVAAADAQRGIQEQERRIRGVGCHVLGDRIELRLILHGSDPHRLGRHVHLTSRFFKVNSALAA
jgi:hypothetical protein